MSNKKIFSNKMIIIYLKFTYLTDHLTICLNQTTSAVYCWQSAEIAIYLFALTAVCSNLCLFDEDYKICVHWPRKTSHIVKMFLWKPSLLPIPKQFQIFALPNICTTKKCKM